MSFSGSFLRNLSRLLFAPALLLPFSLLWAQTQATQAPTAPAITANADEVALDLVVRTKRGKPVVDLRPTDLRVTDNGSPVKLSDLHLVTSDSQSEHLVTLLFDRLDPTPAKSARELSGRILKAIPEKGYSFAVLQMSGRLRLLQGYSSDPDLIQRAVAGITTEGPRTSSGSSSDDGAMTPAEREVLAAAQGETLSADFADRQRSKLLLTALEEAQRIQEDQHLQPSLAALLAIARSERQIPGRKVILYFAQGMNANSDARDAIKSVVGQANRAGVTICAIDTNALDQQVSQRMQGAIAMASLGPGPTFASADSLASHGYGRGASGPPLGQILDSAQNMTNLEFDSMDDLQSPLVSLASDTGGIYIRAGGSSKRPIERLHQDLTSYYEAAYAPSITDYNGAFHAIEIKPLRKDLVVHARAGYFALPPDDGSGVRPFEMPLIRLLSGPALPADLAFRATVLRLGSLPGGNTGALAVEVPVSQLEVRDDATTHISSFHVSIVCQIRDARGNVVQRFSEDIPRHESPDVLRSAEGQYVAMERHFSAPPGTYTLETAVVDHMSNRAGAQRTTFSIQPAAGEPADGGPALSDLVLVRRVEPIHEAASAFEPLRYRNGRVVPDLSGTLPENAKSVSVFFIVHAARTGQPQLALEILRNGESLGRMPLELSQTGAGALPYLGTIQGRSFQPGRYELRATLTQNGQTAASSAAFTVDGTIAASNAPAASFSAMTGSAESAAEAAADAKLTSDAALSNSRFVVSSPVNPVPPPTAEDIQEIIEGTRQRALAWSDSLPNFFCIETTDRSTDASGRGDWKHRDTIVQLMRYIDHQESRTTLEINGEHSSVEASDLEGARSVGEFGGMLRLVFAPTAQAKFEWKESDVLDGQPVQVFAFTVDQAHSDFDLAGENNRAMTVAFHGLTWIDAATHSVRRVTIDADRIPDNFLVHATSVSVDYAWIAVANHDYLLPVRGALSLREGKHQSVLNEFEFRNYRRFGAQVRVLTKEESEALPRQSPPPQP